ncbi:unnamed protein product [Rhodiola kirilowii]
MEKISGCARFLETSKPYFAMIALQFGYAGMNIITKVSLNCGMSHYVLVVYRHAFATASIAPFALIFEWKNQPRITYRVFTQLFVLGLLGPVIDQNFYYAGLKYTSPTFACAITNMLPALTFVMAVIFRMEIIDIKKIRCQAKIIGTAVTVAGAMLMTLYKGPIVEMLSSSNRQTEGTGAAAAPSDKDWFKGSMLVMIATLAWASLFVLQTEALKTYKKHQLSLTSLVCFFGTLQAVVVTFALERDMSAWKIGFDMNLLTAAYSGIVASSVAYYVQGLVIKQKGPVFATAFSPLMMIIVAVMGSFILEEQIFLGGILGSVLIVMGLYSVLWGKHKEDLDKKNSTTEDQMLEETSNSIKCQENEDIESKGEDLKKTATPQLISSSASLPISMSAQKFNIKVSEEPEH